MSVLPTLVSSENGWKGLLIAMEMLRGGASALDAVEAAARVVEDDPDDHSVGYSGMANAAGDVELDASIMDGETLAAGAVAAVRDYAHPITLARKVMQMTGHVLLVGRGGERLAAEAGFTTESQHTERSQEIWRERFAHYGIEPLAAGSTEPLAPIANLLTQPLELDRSVYFEKDLSRPAIEVERPETGLRTGTVNFLALDGKGKMASAVTTSGMAWKYPGRVGDSPIIGAGNYCDGRYGAAACTGLGELAIRAGTARSLVLYLKMGMDVRAAGMEALQDLTSLAYDGKHSMNIVALTPQGEHAGFSTAEGKRYLYMRADMSEPEFMPRATR